jgi:hypothetical protein
MSSVYAPAPLRAATAASRSLTSAYPTRREAFRAAVLAKFSRFPTFAVGCGLISIAKKTQAATDPAVLCISYNFPRCRELYVATAMNGWSRIPPDDQRQIDSQSPQFVNELISSLLPLTRATQTSPIVPRVH